MSTIIDGSNSVTINSGAVLGITSGTAQASTSGTSIDFTGIPSWVKRVTVMFNGVSLSGTSQILVQIGSGSVTTTGYVSASASAGNGAATVVVNSTSGFIIRTYAATNALYGTMGIVSVGGNVYVSSHSSTAATVNGETGGGGVTLSGAIDRVRITTVNGTDTFDAGSINILYE